MTPDDSTVPPSPPSDALAPDAKAAPQARNPLHGLTLEAILTQLVAAYGWEGLGQRINIRCFTSDPSIASSLKFLRKTPWAREKVESLFLFMQREQRRGRL
ncbi:VF530 family DNA-binding protein [Rhodoferax sp.]|uniref:VF530 family protein n=1 Tax=Rhodoferax sp. TaxID=50421 RepID=UPI00374D9223